MKATKTQSLDRLDRLVRQFADPGNRPGPYIVMSRGALHMVMDAHNDLVVWSDDLEACEVAAACMNAQLQRTPRINGEATDQGPTMKITITRKDWHKGINYQSTCACLLANAIKRQLKQRRAAVMPGEVAWAGKWRNYDESIIEDRLKAAHTDPSLLPITINLK